MIIKSSQKLAVFLLGAALGAVLTPMPGFASHPEVSLLGSDFEIDTDANLKLDDAAPSIDWGSVPQGTSAGTEIRKADTASGATDESFGQGTKEDTAVPSVVDGSIPPNKSDLKFFGIYQEGATTDGFLNLYWSRVQEPSGTTNMDFELNKKQCTPNQTPADPDCSANGITPIRSAGDKLIQYDLSQGGTNPLLFVSTWVTTGTASVVCEASNSVPCWGKKVNLTTSGDATGSINTSAIPEAESDGLGAHSARTFGEAQLKLSALIPAGQCQGFGSAYLKSRSSDSFTSALKDFVPPADVNISVCAVINIVKQDDADPPNALNGAVFTLFNDDGGTPGVFDDANSADPDTSTGKTCTTSGSGLLAGKCTISDVFAGDYCVVETTTPSGYETAAPQCITVVQDVNQTLTFTDPRHGAISVTKTAKHAGSGSANLAATFTVKQGTTTIGTITTNGTTGIGCLGDLVAGNYTVEETTGPTGYAKDTDVETVTVTSGGTCANNVPTGANNVSFENIPLTNVTVSVDSQVSGGTSTVIDCGGGNTATTAANGDGSLTVNNLQPTAPSVTLTCTITIDP